jgi:tetratricopeptide (TPR) repeat protein
LSDDPESETPPPAPAEIELVIGGKRCRRTYEQAFALGCALLEKGHIDDAAKLFERLEEFPDRGPRAFIMQAFCEAAAMRFEESSKQLTDVFSGEHQEIAKVLQNAFVSFHVGIRQDALETMTELVNTHRDLPTLCLLLGNMLRAADRLALARKCWSLAIHRDRPGGAVAAAAMRRLRDSTDESSVSS